MNHCGHFTRYQYHYSYPSIFTYSLTPPSDISDQANFTTYNIVAFLHGNVIKSFNVVPTFLDEASLRWVETGGIYGATCLANTFVTKRVSSIVIKGDVDNEQAIKSRSFQGRSSGQKYLYPELSGILCSSYFLIFCLIRGNQDNHIAANTLPL